MAEFKEIEKDLNEAVKTINAGVNDPMKAWIEEKKAADSVPLTSADSKPAAPTSPAVTPPPAPENSIAPPALEQTPPVAAPVTTIADDAPAAPTSPKTADGPQS